MAAALLVALAVLLAGLAAPTGPAEAASVGRPLDCRLETAATVDQPLTRREVDRCVAALVDQLARLHRALEQAEARITELERQQRRTR